MKITRFFIVGVSNTLLTYLLYVVLFKLGIDYKYSLFFVYFFGIIFGYVLNRYWTFSSSFEVTLANSFALALKDLRIIRYAESDPTAQKLATIR